MSEARVLLEQIERAVIAHGKLTPQLRDDLRRFLGHPRGVADTHEHEARFARIFELLGDAKVDFDPLRDPDWQPTREFYDEVTSALSAELVLLRARLDTAERKMEGANNGYLLLRALIDRRPPDTEARESYADGYTAGLIEAMHVMNRAAVAAAAALCVEGTEGE